MRLSIKHIGLGDSIWQPAASTPVSRRALAKTEARLARLFKHNADFTLDGMPDESAGLDIVIAIRNRKNLSITFSVLNKNGDSCAASHNDFPLSSVFPVAARLMRAPEDALAASLRQLSEGNPPTQAPWRPILRALTPVFSALRKAAPAQG